MSRTDPASHAFVEPASELGGSGAALLARIRKSGRPVIFMQEGRGSAVLLDMAHYERLIDELETLRDVHQAHGDIHAGRVTAHDDAEARLLARYS